MASRSLYPLIVSVSLLSSGCMLIPDVVHEPRYYNPFPQLARVAVVPFFNLSGEPTVNQDRFANAYYNELQSIPGFEVVPVGVVQQAMAATGIEGNSPEEFRQLARILGVDAVLVGAVTEYSPYYPPRLGLAVDWYAANPCFHPIPPGYGLPWGTSEEEYIPQELVDAAEFALAREQLKTQTPVLEAVQQARAKQGAVAKTGASVPVPPPDTDPPDPADGVAHHKADGFAIPIESDAANLPPDWPDPSGFIPPPPRPYPAPCIPQNEPIITHVRLYHGNDSDFTTALADYFYFRDEARFGGWQSYLQRSEDFIRFCCYLHITETLAARGGARKTRVVWRWPIGRYER